MNKKLLSIFLSFTVIFLLLIPVFAYGSVHEGEGKATLLQEGDYGIETASSTHLSGTRAMSAVETAIYNGLIAESSQINLTSYRVPKADIENIFSNVVNDNADLFFVSSSLEYSYYTNNTIAYLMPKYVITGNALEEARAVFSNGVQKALAEVDSSMNDLQKAVTIHDYICSLACYPSIYDSDGYYVPELDEEIYHSAYGFFYNQTIVCAGYTLTYSYLLKQLGIPCEYVGSEAMQHAWNKVYIDGQWYNADLTFDDYDTYDAETTYGAIRHAYFLKSDSYYSSSQNIAWHFGGSTYDGCDANSTTYDTAFWDDVFSRIYVVDGDFYYLDPPNSASVYVFLKKRTQNGTETNLCSGFRAAWLSGSTSFYDENGAVHYAAFTDYLTRLSYLDGRFYVAHSTSIDAVTKTGVNYNVCSLANYPTGLANNEQGNLIYHIYADNNALYELDKMAYFRNHITAEKGVNYNVYPDINLDGVINGKDYAKIYKAQNS